MTACFRWLIYALFVMVTLSFSPARAADTQHVLTQWYRLVLELCLYRHHRVGGDCLRHPWPAQSVWPVERDASATFANRGHL